MTLVEKLNEEVECAVGAIFGDVEKKIDQELEEGKEIKEVISEGDLEAIFKKVKWYIFG